MTAVHTRALASSVATAAAGRTCVAARTPTSVRAGSNQQRLRALGVQAKLAVSAPDDAYEREADQVTEQVMRMPAPGAAPPPQLSPVVPSAQRKCAECEEEKGTLQRKAVGTAAGVAPSNAVPTGLTQPLVPGPGTPLNPATRAFFEPRFGRRLDHVRLHEGPAARVAARSVAARAFALGHDIVFGEPITNNVLAHELTHVLQQDAGAPRGIRRITYGTATGTPPQWANLTVAPVPADERPRVDEAIALVDATVADRAGHAECHQQFESNCPGGTPGTLAAVWGRAVLWKITSPDPTALARGDVNDSNLAYTQDGYDQGAHALASTLVHEAGHNCGIPAGDSHWHADRIATYCMGAGRNEVSTSLGATVGDRSQAVWMLSYRRFLGDWGAGRLRATLGADLNLGGLLPESTSKIGNDPRPPADFGSAMGGLNTRLGGWGGSRFGGIGLRFETGIGIGRFNLRPAAPEDSPATTIAPSWVLQVGPRAEFLIPTGGGRVMPLSVSAAYRLAQPLNTEAEAIHSAIGSLEFRF